MTTLVDAFGIDDVEGFKAAFWDDKGEQRFFCIEGIKVEATLKDHEIKFGNHKKHPCILKKFSFKPAGKHKADLHFTATLDEPDQSLITTLCDYLNNTHKVEIIAPPDLFSNTKVA